MTTYSALFARIILEPERGLAADGRTGNGGAPKFLDVFHDEVRALEVTDKRPLFRVVHRVGHVAHEDDILADVDHLPDADRPAKDAHVQVHAHENDIFNAVLREQVVGFLPVVGDGVALIVDLDEVDLCLLYTSPSPRD